MRACLTISLVLMLLAPNCLAATRNVIPFDDGWKFHRGDADNASSIEFDDTGWDAVTLPHTWNADTDPPQGNYYRGPGWYRKSFRMAPEWRGRRVFVRFGAASLVAEVFLNGILIGEHKGGFAAICFELTPQLREGTNLVAVRVDNSRHEDVIPLSGDFTVFGGLYRSVSADHADVNVKTEVSNGSTAPRTVEIQVRVEDARGSIVARARETVTVAPGQMLPVTRALTLAHPHLWNGTTNPYLYSVHVELAERGATIDAVEQPLGLRFVSFDAKRGLLLNGKRLEVHGVCRHQDWAGKGWAIGTKEQDLDMQLMRAMGVNAVRLAHYQHNDYFYQLADRHGLIVWAELAMVDWVRGTAAFRENARQQLTELIRQNMNHPSILMWSLYNEIRPANTDDPIPIVGELKELAKQEDPNRPTTGALSFDWNRETPPSRRIDRPARSQCLPRLVHSNAKRHGSHHR